MVSHEFKCIFVHSPKTGGTSINKAFGMDWYHPDVHFMNSGVCGADAAKKPDDYFMFSVVRNPYDRFISGWKFAPFTRERSLMDVLGNLPAYPPDMRVITDPDSEYYAGAHISTKQSDRLLLSNGSIGVNLVIRYENMQRGFDKVCDVIGKPRQILPFENRTERAPYRHYFDQEPEALKLFEEYFKSDLELFNYVY
jgi:hypothetical protein